MKKNPRFIQSLIASVFLSFNCYAVDQLGDKKLYAEAEKFVEEHSLTKDFDVLKKSALRGDFDKIDPTIKKDFLVYWELISEANAFDRKAKLSYEIADGFYKSGFQQVLDQYNDSAEFNKVADKEVEKMKKMNLKILEEKEGVFKKAALRGKFDDFDATIRKFFEASDKERLEAKKYDKKAQDLYFKAKKISAQGLIKIMKIPPEKLEINDNSNQN